MTEIFKCRKAGTKCCAPKSLIKEAALGQIDEMHIKYTTTPNPGAAPFTVQPVTMQTSKFFHSLLFEFVTHNVWLSNGSPTYDDDTKKPSLQQIRMRS